MSDSAFKRIHAASTPGKFRQHAIVPVEGIYVGKGASLPGGYYQDVCIACVLGIEATAASSFIEAYTCLSTDPRLDRLARLAGLDVAYAAGLSDGWEDTTEHQTHASGDGSEAYFAGIEDGRAAHVACVEDGVEF